MHFCPADAANAAPAEPASGVDRITGFEYPDDFFYVKNFWKNKKN